MNHEQCLERVKTWHTRLLHREEDQRSWGATTVERKPHKRYSFFCLFVWLFFISKLCLLRKKVFGLCSFVSPPLNPVRNFEDLNGKTFLFFPYISKALKRIWLLLLQRNNFSFSYRGWFYGTSMVWKHLCSREMLVAHTWSCFFCVAE